MAAGFLSVFHSVSLTRRYMHMFGAFISVISPHLTSSDLISPELNALRLVAATAIVLLYVVVIYLNCLTEVRISQQTAVVAILADNCHPSTYYPYSTVTNAQKMQRFWRQDCEIDGQTYTNSMEAIWLKYFSLRLKFCNDRGEISRFILVDVIWPNVQRATAAGESCSV